MTSKKSSFNVDAAIYDKGRPQYHSDVIEWIIEKAGLTVEHDLLEIAPGTGQATIGFGERGFKIQCVELGNDLARILRKNTKDMDVSVDVSAFEEWEPSNNRKYNMVYCATAFHWIDSDIKYRKCYDLIEGEGKLILIWNVASQSQNPMIQAAYNELWSYYPDKIHIDSETIKEQRKAEIAESGYFQLVDYLDYTWESRRSREEVIDEFYSQSSFLSLDEEHKYVLKSRIDTIFEALDEDLDKMSTTVYICDKVD
jgi:protein-L-isoaspartate O-methyltransferase